MQLCFDATRFGFGLAEAVEMAAAKGLPAIEFTFEPFSVTTAASRKLSLAENDYLNQVAQTGARLAVSVAALRLNYLLDLTDKSSVKQFKGMVDKLSAVANVLECPRILFYLEAESSNGLGTLAEEQLAPIAEHLAAKNVHLVLSLATPPCYQGLSLKHWRGLSPDEWRDLLTHVPDLSLAFSAADCAWQGIDYLKVLSGLVQGIDYVEALDVEVNRGLLSDSGLFGPLWWRYKTPSKGQIDWRQLVEALKLYDFQGTISIHLEDEFVAQDPFELSEALDSSTRLLAPLLKY